MMCTDIYQAYANPSARKVRAYYEICERYDDYVREGKWKMHTHVFVRSKNTCFFTTYAEFTDVDGRDGYIIEYPTRTEVKYF